MSNDDKEASPRGRPIKNTMPEPIPGHAGEHRAGIADNTAQKSR